MKLLSEAAEYALRSVVWLAQRPPGPYKTRQIAAGTHAPPGYLVKSLQALAHHQILAGQRGSTGGFTLVRDPKTLSVLEVINAVDPIERIDVCPLGLAAHGKQLCPLHRRIDDAMASIEREFGETTIAEVIRNRRTSVPLCAGLRFCEAGSQRSGARGQRSGTDQ